MDCTVVLSSCSLPRKNNERVEEKKGASGGQKGKKAAHWLMELDENLPARRAKASTRNDCLCVCVKGRGANAVLAHLQKSRWQAPAQT
jgi:hypothetical protein